MPLAEAPLPVIKISKKKSPQRWWISFALKRKETTLTDPPRKNPRNTRVTSAQELGTVSKNNFRGITLVRGPRWGIHSLTLKISWLGCITIKFLTFVRFL